MHWQHVLPTRPQAAAYKLQQQQHIQHSSGSEINAPCRAARKRSAHATFATGKLVIFLFGGWVEHLYAFDSLGVCEIYDFLRSVKRILCTTNIRHFIVAFTDTTVEATANSQEPAAPRPLSQPSSL